MAKEIPNVANLVPGLGLVEEIVEGSKPEEKAARSIKKGVKSRATRELKTVQATLVLKPSVKEALKELSWREHRSFNDYVGEILENHVKRNWKE